MFRVWAVGRCLHRGALHRGALNRRALHGGAQHGGGVNRDLVMEQLSVCAGEDQLLEVVGKNKAKLTVNHVGRAITMLWRFQKERPEILRTVELIRSHPQFLSLRVLAENKIALMDDSVLVDMLYNVLRYRVQWLLHIPFRQIDVYILYIIRHIVCSTYC